jgi:hypothetical protein
VIIPIKRFLYKGFVDPLSIHLHIVLILHKALRVLTWPMQTTGTWSNIYECQKDYEKQHFVDIRMCMGVKSPQVFMLPHKFKWQLKTIVCPQVLACHPSKLIMTSWISENSISKKPPGSHSPLLIRLQPPGSHSPLLIRLQPPGSMPPRSTMMWVAVGMLCFTRVRYMWRRSCSSVCAGSRAKLIPGIQEYFCSS